MRKRRVTKNKSKAAILWMWEHTKMIVNCLSVLYVLNWLYSLVVIVVAIKETGQFSYLDTLISETNETFRIVVFQAPKAKTCDCRWNPYGDG